MYLLASILDSTVVVLDLVALFVRDNGLVSHGQN